MDRRSLVEKGLGWFTEISDIKKFVILELFYVAALRFKAGFFSNMKRKYEKTIREAAKKVIFLVARPLRPYPPPPLLVVTKKNNFYLFCGFPKCFYAYSTAPLSYLLES